MPTIDAHPADNLVFTTSYGGGSSWAAVREATTGTGLGLVSRTSSSHSQIFVNFGRGPGFYVCQRGFYFFDTSSVTGTVASVDFELYGKSSYPVSSGRHKIVKSTAFGGDGSAALATSDFDAIVGWDHDAECENGVNVTDYSSIYDIAASSWSTSGYNSFTGTSALKTDMQNEDVVIICILVYDYDYKYADITSNTNLFTNAWWADHTSGYRPRLNYTIASGYESIPLGVTPPNIGKINGVATADISKVNGI